MKAKMMVINFRVPADLRRGTYWLMSSTAFFTISLVSFMML